MELLRVEQLRSGTVVALIRGDDRRLTACLASPRLVRMLRCAGPDDIPDSIVRGAKIQFSLERGSFQLRFPLKGGGAQFSAPRDSSEPEVPASSPEQHQASTLIRALHQSQQDYDYPRTVELARDLRSFLKSDLLHPYAVLRTMLEAYSSLEWGDRLFTCWFLAHIQELLNIVHLSMLLSSVSLSATSQHYLRQHLDLLPPDEEPTDRLHLYMQCYLEIGRSGVDALAANQFPASDEFRGQLVKTIALLRESHGRISEAVQFGSEFYRMSLFHRAISIHLAAQVAHSNPEGAEFLLTFLRPDTQVSWPLRYLAMMKLAEVLDFLEPQLQKKVLEGHLPKTHGLMQMIGTVEGEDAWILRAAAFHAFTIVEMQCGNEDIRDLAGSALESARCSEVDLRMRKFMRHSRSLKRLIDPSTEEFLSSPQSLLMTFPSGVGRAYLGDLNSLEVSLFEKDFLHGSARVVICKYLAIVTGGCDHMKYCYELSLVSGEFMKLANLKEGRYWHAGAVLEGEVWVTGGRNKTGVLRTVECLRAGKWIEMSPMSMQRDSHTAVVVRRTMYVFGGAGCEDAPLSIEKLAPSGWELLPVKLPQPRTSPGLLFITPSKVLIAGGKHQKDRKEVWQLDVVTGEVLELPKLPMSCCFTSNPVSGRDGFVYMLSSGEMELLEFDLVEQTWRVCAS